MSRARDRRVMVVVAVFMCGLAVGALRPLLGGEKPGAARPARQLKIKPCELTGKVVYPDGKTPAAKAPVRVWNVAQKKFLFETVTDANGAYSIPKLPPGRYVLTFGDRVRVELIVENGDKLPAGPLNVMIPRGRVLFYPSQLTNELAAGAAPGGSSTGIVGKLLTTKVIVIAGTATAVAVVAGHELTDDDNNVVSP